MSDLAKALRLVLHAADWDDLLPSNDYGDDLFDEGLIRTSISVSGSQYSELTPTGEQLVRQATGKSRT